MINGEDHNEAILATRISDPSPDTNNFHIPIKLQTTNGEETISALIDSGATTTFISPNFAKKFALKPLRRPIAILNIDGSPNGHGQIKEYLTTRMVINDHSEQINMAVADIGKQDVILGITWLKKHNPTVDWVNKTLTLDKCGTQCGELHIRATSQWTPDESPPVIDWEIDYDQYLLDEDVGIRANSLVKELEKKAQPIDWKKIVPQRYHRYKKVFSEEESHRLPQHQPWDHEINLDPYKDTGRLRLAPYPVAERWQPAMKEFLRKNLEQGYIRPSKSPYSAPMTFIAKKDGEPRPIIDYRKLNGITIEDRYPLPNIEQTFHKLKEAKYYTKFDVRWGYHNIRIREGDEHKAAFVTTEGLFEPLVMFFGLTNSPATFQRVMDGIFRDMIDQGKIIVYMDDILIYSTTLEDLQENTEEVLRRIEKYDLYLKPAKCEFEKEEIEFLGHLIREGSIVMQSEKVNHIANWEPPYSVKSLQRFLGFANYYRRFIQGFGKICTPLYALIKKDKPWEWTPDAQKAFETLKKAFTTGPVLKTWTTELPTRIECDASNYAIGAILSQQHTDEKGKKKWHPVAFLSKAMLPAERNYSIYDKEALAVRTAILQWAVFLQNVVEPAVILTDHQALAYWEKERSLNGRQWRWFEDLKPYKWVITYRPGKSNHKADFLSRYPTQDDSEKERKQAFYPEERRVIEPLKDEWFEPTKGAKYDSTPDVANLNATIRAAIIDPYDSLPKPSHLWHMIQEAKEYDSEAEEARKALEGKESLRLNDKWTMKEGYLMFKERFYVPKDEGIREETIRLHHDVPLAGHPGRAKTLELITRNYYWPGMTRLVNTYVDECIKCQQNKTIRHAVNPPLNPIDPPQNPGEVLTADFIVKLPKSEQYDSVLVVVDKATKLVTFIPTTESIGAEGTIELLWNNIIPRFGIPKKIITDRGPQFASKLARETHRLMGTQTSLSTAYHPQTDGQTERINQELETYLRIYVSMYQDDWVKWLKQAEFAINNRVNESTQESPFYLYCGFHPQTTWPPVTLSPVPTAGERVRLLQMVREDIQSAAKLSIERVKENYDRHTTQNKDFKPGTKVWLEATNILIGRPSKKLSQKRLGPYPIKRKIGSAAYELTLPKSLRIHPVFHASLLTLYKPNTLKGRKQELPPPPELIDNQPEFEVEHILDHYPPSAKSPADIKKYLVHWKGYGTQDDSWEPRSHLSHSREILQRYHSIYLDPSTRIPKGHKTL